MRQAFNPGLLDYVPVTPIEAVSQATQEAVVIPWPKHKGPAVDELHGGTFVQWPRQGTQQMGTAPHIPAVSVQHRVEELVTPVVRYMAELRHERTKDSFVVPVLFFGPQEEVAVFAKGGITLLAGRSTLTVGLPVQSLEDVVAEVITQPFPVLGDEVYEDLIHITE